MNEALTALENKGGRALSHARIVRHFFWAFPCVIAAMIIFTFGDVVEMLSGSTQEDDDDAAAAGGISILEFMVPAILLVGFILVARYVSVAGWWTWFVAPTYLGLLVWQPCVGTSTLDRRAGHRRQSSRNCSMKGTTKCASKWMRLTPSPDSSARESRLPWPVTLKSASAAAAWVVARRLHSQQLQCSVVQVETHPVQRERTL